MYTHARDQREEGGFRFYRPGGYAQLSRAAVRVPSIVRRFRPSGQSVSRSRTRAHNDTVEVGGGGVSAQETSRPLPDGLADGTRMKPAAWAVDRRSRETDDVAERIRPTSSRSARASKRFAPTDVVMYAAHRRTGNAKWSFTFARAYVLAIDHFVSYRIYVVCEKQKYVSRAWAVIRVLCVCVCTGYLPSGDTNDWNMTRKNRTV